MIEILQIISNEKEGNSAASTPKLKRDNSASALSSTNNGKENVEDGGSTNSWDADDDRILLEDGIGSATLHCKVNLL